MKIKSLILSVLLTLFLVGCGGDNSDSPVSIENIQDLTEINTTIQSLSLVVPHSSYEITKNSQVVELDVRVYDDKNVPYSEGQVAIKNNSAILLGRDVGTFNKYSAEIVNGVASFEYIAPSNLDENTSDLTFSFYHDSGLSNTSNITFKITPEVNQTILTTYSLISTPSGGEYTMSLESSKQMTFVLKDEDGNKIADDQIIDLTLTSLNPSLGIFEDTNGRSGISLGFTGENGVSLNVKSNTLSGVVPIRGVINFKDLNGDIKTIEKTFNMVILSGPPSAISLSYASTEQNATTAKFIENWVVSVTDKYNNKVSTNPAISMGMIAGYAKSSVVNSNPNNYLYYRPSEGGTLINSSPDIFDAPANVFANVDQQNESLVLFGNGYTFDASGKWDFYTYANTDKLELKDDFSGSNTFGLGYAVGNNFRQDQCREGTEWVGTVYPKDNNYIIDESGNMIIQVEYDYYMVGKDVVLWVNFVGQDYQQNASVRIGEARKITLRGQGLDGESYSFGAGFTGTVRLDIDISNTPERYRNANFGYQVEVSGKGAEWSVTDSSMAHEITNCTQNNGVGYVEVTITTGSTEPGAITLTNVLPTSEF